MRFKLLLTNKAYPQSLLNVKTPKEVSEDEKQSWVEGKILDAINLKNPKLKLNYIDYCNLKERFSNFIISNYAGVIVEEKIICEEERESYTARNYFVYEQEEKIFAQRPWIYTMMTSPIESGRNIFISQSIFPTLIDYMKLFKDSPSYEITNHPIYFINIVNKKIVAQSIIESIHSLSLMGICYIDVFNSTSNIATRTLSLKEYVIKFDNSNFDEQNQRYSCDKYEIDFQNKIFYIKTNDLVVGRYLVQRNSHIDFNGSSEKFYWMNTLPLIIRAVAEKFYVNYEALKVFCDRRNEFSQQSSKFSRFETLLLYIKKLNLED